MPVADMVIVPGRISGVVCSCAAVTAWEWDYKLLIHCRQVHQDNITVILL